MNDTRQRVMKWTFWILIACVAGLFVLAGMTVLRHAPRTPAQALAELQARTEQGLIGPEQEIDELGRLLTSAQRAGHGLMVTRVRFTRAQLLLELGAWDEARADLEAVLESSEDPFEVERLLVEVEKLAGNLDPGIARAQRLLGQHDDVPGVSVQLGELHMLRAERELAQCSPGLDRALVPEDEERARALFRRGAAIAPQDPRRVAVSQKLWRLFANEDHVRQETLLAMDRASRDLDAARTAFAGSLEVEIDSHAVAGLMDLMARAGRREATLDLGIAALPYAQLRTHPETILILIRTLREAGHLAFAAEFANWWVQNPEDDRKSATLYFECCLTLYEAELWGPLLVASNLLSEVDDSTLQPTANFFRGQAQVSRKSFVDGKRYLNDYLGSAAAEPIPGARAITWRALAQCWSALDNTLYERGALEEAGRLPGGLDGEGWLRLSELLLEETHSGYRTPQENWARAMSLLPERNDELFERWVEIGEEELLSTAFDPAGERRAMLRAETWTPRSGLSFYELYRLALTHQSQGDAERALIAARHLAERLPGFLPALDLALDLSLSLGYRELAASLALERMKQVGRDERTEFALEELGETSFSAEQTLELMRIDPETAGRARIARALRASAELEHALAVLGDLEDLELAPELVRMGAEMLVELGRYAEAHDALERLQLDADSARDPGVDSGVDSGTDSGIGRGRAERTATGLDPVDNPDDLSVLLEVLVGLEDGIGLEILVDDLLNAGRPDAEAWIGAADVLFRAHRPELADLLLAELDRRSLGPLGQVLERRALAAFVRDDVDAAARAITRAEAFSGAERTGLLRILLLLRKGSRDELPDAVRELRRGDYQLSSRQELALRMLAGENEEARALADEALRLRWREPVWGLLDALLRTAEGRELEVSPYFGPEAEVETRLFLQGSAAAPHAARNVLGLLLALDDALLLPWAELELAALDPAAWGHLWPTFLVIPQFPRPAQVSGARAALEALTDEFPRFGPAWDRRDRLAQAARDGPVDERRIALRSARRHALGEAMSSELELDLDLAREAELAGKTRAAVLSALSALEADPAATAAHWLLGRVYRTSAMYEASLESFHAALAATPPASDLPLTIDAIDAIESAYRAQALTGEACMAELARVAQRVPDDPALALMRARLELEFDPRNPALEVTRAYAHLDAFKEAHVDRPLDTLRRGSAAAWARFLATIDPERARVFVAAQLALRPGALDMWILEGEVLQVEGDLQAALTHFRTLQRMAPRETQVLRKLIELEALAGAGNKAVAKSATMIRDSEEPSDTDLELTYWRAVAIMSSGSRGVVNSLDRLARVWLMRDQLQGGLEPRRVGLRYASALVARGGAPERERAREVLAELVQDLDDPYQRELVRALAGLALHDPLPPAE